MEISKTMTTFIVIVLILIIISNLILFRRINILGSRTNRLKRRYDALFRGQNLDMEDILVSNAELLNDHSAILENLSKMVESDNKNLTSRLGKLENENKLVLDQVKSESRDQIDIMETKLEDSIDHVNKLAQNELKRLSDRTSAIVEENMEKTALCIQKLAFVRYNAFDYLTNDLSYSLALLNDFNDGVIITSIFGREQSSTYIKEIKKGKSFSKLSEHEIQALKKAINNQSSLSNDDK